MGGRKAWRFRDVNTGETYFLPVNPLSDKGGLAVRKQVKYEVAASTYYSSSYGLRVDDVVIQDSPDEIYRFSYEGTLYTQEEYEALEYWFNKNEPWELRDDLGREFLVYAESFAPVRARSVQFKWKHRYTITGMVIRELGV